MALIDKHWRFFVRHHLSFRPRHKHAAPMDFLADGDELDVRTLVDEAIRRDRASFEIRSNDVVRLTTLDVRPDDEIAIFLFRRSDPAAAAQVLENQKTRKLRAIKIGPNEYPAISAHLFMSLKKQRLPNPTYRCLMEEMPGLGRTYMHSILHDIVSAYTYTYQFKKEERETYTIVGFEGVPSDTIGGALKGSEVPYVELVRPGRIEGLDAAGYIVPREQRMKLMLRVDKPGQILEALDKIKNWMIGANWSEMRVRLDLPEDRSRMISIARDESAKDVLFIRSVQVLAKKPIPAATEVINEELVDKALELFAKKD